MGDEVLKVIPSPEELQVVGLQNQGWKCPEVGCSYVAANISILGLHRFQFHNFRTKHRRGAENAHYHCPVADCYFGPQSERYFKNIDILRAHYMKLHSEKKFSCSKCKKTFGLERDWHRHETECGQSFPCVGCEKVYSNRSALRRHCDCNGHQFPAQERKVKSVREPESKPGKVLSTIKMRPCTSTANITLPKQILPKTSSQTQSLHIQTDTPGCLFFISKMTSDSSISQAVQTIDRANRTRSAAIQTSLDFNSGHIVALNQTERLSTGIQTVWPSISSLNVAQTQTGDSILQKAMEKASIPVLNVSKGTQKSPSGHKRKKQQKISCTAGSQTFYSATAVKRSHIESADSSPTVQQQPEVSSVGIAQNGMGQTLDLMSTMSTQTHLSCVSEQIFPKFYSMESGIQLQDCHTQTQCDTLSYGQEVSFYRDQTIIPRDFVPSSDQVTQTKSDYFSIDQVTQTGNINTVYFNGTSLPFAIQDSQTQTAFSSLNSDIINNGHNQTALAGINVPQVQEQGTTCEGLLEIGEGDDDTVKFHLESDSFLQAGKCPDKSLSTGESSNDLAGFLMEVIRSDMEESKNLQRNTRPEDDLYRSAKNTDEKLSLPAVSMETQTLGNLGMDSMTQTVDEFGWDISTQTADFLGWDMGTQTADYLLTDTMTQTGDDLLEFLTNDTHTQTLDDFYLSLLPDESSRVQSCPRTSTSDAMTEVHLDDLFEDHASTQTIWDTEDQMLDLHDSSFSVDAPFESSEQSNGAYPELCFMNEHPGSQPEYSDSCGRKWKHALSSEAQMTFSELGRETETAETQTAFDPLFYHLQSEDLRSFGLNRTVKYLESSHTQTTLDPMLPSVAMDDDPMPFYNHSANFETETSETQTRTDDTGRETAECQTPWDDDWISMGTSETQTQNADLFGVSFSDTQTEPTWPRQII
ncbi:hypothetical protein BsWGS_16293 [Bradybaena similaris]